MSDLPENKPRYAPIPNSPHIAPSFGVPAHELNPEAVAALRARVREEMIALVKVDALLRAPRAAAPRTDLAQVRDFVVRQAAKPVVLPVAPDSPRKKPGLVVGPPEQRVIEREYWVNMSMACEIMKCNRTIAAGRAYGRRWARRLADKQVFYLKADVDGYKSKKPGRHAVRA